MGSIVQRHPLFQLYSFYTLGLALLFLGFYLFEEQLHWWQPAAPRLLPIVLTGYLALAIGNIIRTRSRYAQRANAFFPSLLAEVLLLGLLMVYLTPLQQDLKFFMNLKYFVIDCLRINKHPSHYNLNEVIELTKIIRPKKTILTNLHADLDYNYL